MKEECQHGGQASDPTLGDDVKVVDDEAQNTVYVGNLAQQANEAELEALFAHLGKPTQVKILRDKLTGSSSGFGFVTFPERSKAELAIASLNGQMAWGRPLKLHWAQQRGGPVVAPSSPEAQLFDVFVGDLARDVDEQTLQNVFNQAGEVARVSVMWDYPSGRNKGYGFVSFKSQEVRGMACKAWGDCMPARAPA